MAFLKDEAERIYHALFRMKIPESVRYHFDNLDGKFKIVFPESEIKKYNEYALKVHDLEALELAARFFKKLPVLTTKIKIMVYLAETVPENYSVYINEKSNFIAGYVLLIAAAFRSLYKFIKGMLLLVFFSP